MPFYEYECQNCKFYTELMQKISDPPLEKCPSCGKKAMKKLISAPVFRLKGDGWYETDFKRDDENKRNLAGVDKEDKAESESGAKPAEDKGEAKPAATPETKATPASEPKRESASASVRSSRPATAAKGKSKPAAKASRAPSKPKAKAKTKAKGKAKKGRR